MDLLLLLYPLAILGAVAVLIVVARLASLVHHYVLYSFSFSKYRGDWAVITGASAGIGAAMAHSLARRGMNVILIARSTSKLEELAESIRTKHSVDTRVISYDFSQGVSSDAFAALLSEVSGLKPTVLINNVGVNVEFPTDLVDMDSTLAQRIVDINVSVPAALTRALLPPIVESGRGIVLCLSSAGGAVSPAPLLSVYAGTKAFNDAFAIALAGEVQHLKDVHVHSLTPFFVESAMAKMRAGFTVPSADKFAEMALKQVGSPHPRLQPYWVHYVMQIGLTSLPLSAQVAYVTKLHRSIRRRALKKKARMEKAAAEGKKASS